MSDRNVTLIVTLAGLGVLAYLYMTRAQQGYAIVTEGGDTSSDVKSELNKIADFGTSVVKQSVANVAAGDPTGTGSDWLNWLLVSPFALLAILP